MSILQAPVMRVPASARQPVSDQQAGFADGLNTVSNDFALTPGQMRRCDNIRLVDVGAATKRSGTQRSSTTALAAAPVKNGYTWRKDSATQYLVATCNGVLYTTQYGAFPLTWTNQGGTFGTVTPSLVGFRDTSANVLYLATGGALQKWDGTTLSTIAPASQVTGVTVYHDRLWGWGVAGSLDSIWYSNLSSASASIGGDSLGVAASKGGQIIIRTFGQQDVIACAPVGSSLLIFHRVGVSRLTGYGQSDITVSPDILTNEVGLIGPEALAVHALSYETAYGATGSAAVYFVSPSGVYVANEQAVTPLATPTKPDPVLPQLQTLSATNLAAVKCRYNKATRELWVQLPTIGIYIYHTILKSWSGPFVDGYLSPDTTCLFEAFTTANQPVMMRGDATGYVSLCDAPGVFLDNVTAAGTGGTTYNAVIQCHRMYCGDPTRANAFMWASVLAALSGSATIGVSWVTLTGAGNFSLTVAASATTWGGVGSVWGAGAWGVGGQAPIYVPLSGTGAFIDIIITDSGQAAAQYASVQISGYAYGRR
jgi:hypothetical protein